MQCGAVDDLKWKNSKVQDALVKATTDYIYKIKLAHNDKLPKCYVNEILVTMKLDTNGLIQVKLKKNETFAIKYE